MLLFNIFTNGLDDGTECMLSKFADNIKLGEVSDTLVGRARIQNDLDRLEKWPSIVLFDFHLIEHLALGRE